MFESCAPFPFFDYFRIPYTVVPGSGTGLPPFLGRLRSRSGRALVWPRSDLMRGEAGWVAGRHRLGSSWLVGHVLRDAAVTSRLPGWRSAAPVLDAAGCPIASVRTSPDGDVFLPFDMGEVMQTFWSERYQRIGAGRVTARGRTALLHGYYAVRPALPRGAQLAMRRRYTGIQGRAPFPRWPAEDSLHDLYGWLLELVAGLAGGPVPWLGAWPGEFSWALVLTHDVETAAGCRAISLLRDPERAAGYRSCWNFVPERYALDPALLGRLRNDGCEVGVHGLRHDGRDLGSRASFEARLPAVRAYADRWQAVGFRSPATQRVWEWMPELGFDYDASYPDTDPYEPQPGGCCTYLPFFNQRQVELPLTLPQDHTLFVVLRRSGAATWLDKARHLRARGGLAQVLTHPDYAGAPGAAAAWQQLLDEFRDDATAWRALPREVSAWWRRRAASTLHETADGWRITGPAADDGRVRFVVPATSALPSPAGSSP